MISGHQEYEALIEAKMRQVYSGEVIDHALHPRNLGDMKDADAFGRITGPCGDTMEIWLKVKDDKIIDSAFLVDGCVATLACGSMITELARGERVSQAIGISQQDVLDALDGLPEGNKHCALLAANTLKEAVRDFLVSKKEPWKKLYRTY